MEASSSVTSALSLVLAFLSAAALAQNRYYEPDRALLDPELAQIPDDILVCYSDRRLWDRHRRLPQSVDSLAAILRKVELHPDVVRWDPGQLAAAIVHKFRFDGIVYDACVDTSTGAVPFRIDWQVEFPKMALIWQLILGDREDFPDDALTQEEKCSLHWMLSYSVNTTMRADEIFWATDFGAPRDPYAFDVNYNHGSGNWADDKKILWPGDLAYEVRPPYGSPAFGSSQPRRPTWRDCDDKKVDSFSPWEMGVIWSPSGPLAAGPMMAGLAAGLQPRTVTWEAGYVENGWAASLAGDLGQTALMKRKDEPYLGPDGFFNSTICPAEFYLRALSTPPVFSHLTVAEINGGIDGLLMSEYAEEWESRSEFTLSQVVDSYYSLQGIHVQGSAPFLSACDRYSNYMKLISPDKLTDQAYIFGVELKNVLVAPVEDSSLRAAIGFAKTLLDEEVNILDQTLNDYGPCRDQRERDGYVLEHHAEQDYNPIDAEFESDGIADLAVILDNSVYTYEDEVFMQQVAAAVSGNLDVWATLIKDGNREEMAQGGSIFELLEGRYGDVLLSTHGGANSEFYVDNGYGGYYGSYVRNQTEDIYSSAQLACEALKVPFPPVADNDPATALEAAASRMYARLLENEEEQGDGEVTAGGGRAQVILMIMFGRVNSGDRAALNDAVYRMRRYYPSTQLLIATRWAPRQEFEDLVLYPELDVFVLEQYDEELRAERDGYRIAERTKQVPGALTYVCEDPERPEYSEGRHRVVVYVRPDTQRFLEINPKYFYRLDDDRGLEVEFRVDHNSVTVCRSRYSPEERALGRSRWEDSEYEEDEEFDPSEECDTATASGGGSGGKVVFRWDEDPCDGVSLTRCRPIYFRLQGVNSGGTRCLTEDGYPCRTADSALVTISHSGMLCGASDNGPSMLALTAATAMSLLLKRLNS